jgi:hypothetical protein
MYINWLRGDGKPVAQARASFSKLKRAFTLTERVPACCDMAAITKCV